MTHTYLKYFATLLCLAALDSNAQSLTITNNSYCKLEYELIASVGTPCGDECKTTGKIAAKTTVNWPGTTGIKWKCNKADLTWRAFALKEKYAPKIGNCDALPFSGVYQTMQCHTDLEYNWNVEEHTGNITIWILPVILPKKIFSLKVQPETIQGGVNMVIVPMMEISNYIELSNDPIHHSTSSFRVRTNQKFIAGVHTPRQHNNSIVLVADTSALYCNASVCTYLPLSDNEQLTSLNCYCGTDQKFNVIVSDTPNISQMTYTATQP